MAENPLIVTRTRNYLNIKALLILIAILLVALMLVIRYKRRYDEANEGAYAPWRNNCPDYWEETKDKCVRTQLSGGKQNSGISSGFADVACPDDYRFSFAKSDLDESDKKTWASTCEIPWDGYFMEDASNKFYDIRPLEIEEPKTFTCTEDT